MLGVGGVETVDRLIKQAEARNLNNIDAAKMKVSQIDRSSNTIISTTE